MCGHSAPLLWCLCASYVHHLHDLNARPPSTFYSSIPLLPLGMSRSLSLFPFPIALKYVNNSQTDALVVCNPQYCINGDEKLQDQSAIAQDIAMLYAAIPDHTALRGVSEKGRAQFTAFKYERSEVSENYSGEEKSVLPFRNVAAALLLREVFLDQLIVGRSTRGFEQLCLRKQAFACRL